MERHDDAADLHRFYMLEISCDLFGDWLLIRRWGRVGRTRGQSLVRCFPTRAAAAAERAYLARAKRRRGYRLRRRGQIQK